jgi:hypothetical protein
MVKCGVGAANGDVVLDARYRDEQVFVGDLNRTS